LREEGLKSLDQILNPTQPPTEDQTDSLMGHFKTATKVEPESVVTQTSLVREKSLITETSLVKSDQKGLSLTRLASETSLVVENTPEEGSLLEYASSLSYGRGHTRLYHEFTDKVLSLLTAAEQLLYIHLDRYREGGGSTTIPVSWPTLVKRSGLSQSSLIRAAQTMEAKGLIKKVALKLGRGKEQGNRFWVFSVASLVRERSLVTETSLVNGTTIKDKELKENSKKGNELSLDTKSCPDCQGSGFYYPEGTEKGVAKCRHVRLNKSSHLEGKK
jgi:hypothetical protein